MIEILDLRYQKEEIKEFVDGKRIYPGYHMNKNSWITIILDGSIENESLFELIDNSYYLSVGNKNINNKVDLEKYQWKE